MKLERFTVKAQEVLESAQAIARRRDHQELTPEHVMLAMLEQKDGLVAPMLQKVGADVNGVQKKVEAEVEKLPKVAGGNTYLSNRLLKLNDRAEDFAKELKDEYVATEHLLIAMAQDKQGV